MEEIKIADQEGLSKIDVKNLPKRPSQSQYFNRQTISLRSNHYNIVVPKSMEIFVYDFKFIPEVDRDNRKQVRFYIRNFHEKIEKQYGKIEYSGWMMFATKRIENLTLISDIDKKEVKMEIKLTKQCQNLKELMSDSIEKSESTKQIINIIIKNCLKELGYKEIGLRKNFFDVKKKKILESQQIEMWLGVYTSTEYFQSGPKLTIDCASKILRLDTALTYMNDLFYAGKNQQYVKGLLQSQSVIAYYGNYRTYQIHDIDFQKTPEDKFNTTDKQISYSEYYKTRYNIDIKDKKQPLLLHNKRQKTPDGKAIIIKIYLIPELVRMTGLTDQMRSNRKCMQAIAKEKPCQPDQRMSEIHNFSQQLQGKLNQSWNLQLQASELVEGLQMQQPDILSGNSVKAKPVNGLFRLSSTVYEAAQFNSKWVLIYQEQGEQDYNTADYFVKNLQKCSGKLGILLNEPTYISVPNINPKDYATKLIDYLSKNKPLIVVSLIRKFKTTEVYKAIKKACFVSSNKSHVLPCQNVLMETIENADAKISSICTNILLQMNAKMNLAIWLVQPVKNLPKTVMLIGADVHHKKGNKSIIGFCATMNSKFSKFYSRAKEQDKEYDEIMKSIGQFVFEAIVAYYAKNQQLPEHIIFFRDGVGDSQIEEVRQREVKQVLSAFKQIQEKMKITFEPSFAEIIVKKQINDRFFVENQGQSGRGGQQRGARGAEKSSISNAPSGTIINSNVVSNYFDYYLIAQHVNQGTATPTHYNVIYNSTKFTEDQFLELTFRQCFNYFNWQGAIKIPSVVKYADKLAFFYGTYLNRESDQELFEFLYYL